MSKLSEIIAAKRKEVEGRKISMPVEKLEQLPLYNSISYSLKRSLVNPAKNGIIAEFKRSSPPAGLLNKNANLLQVTEAYAANRAAGLSITTGEKANGGSLDDMITARVNEVPILRQDYIIDAYQVVETKAYGADVLMLKASVLTQEEVKEFSSLAHELGLEIVLEIRNEKELGHLTERTDIVAVNNRDPETDLISLDGSAHLSHLIPSGKLKISAGGILRVRDVLNLRQLGYQGFLIGEAFMRYQDPGLAYMKFAAELNDQSLSFPIGNAR